MSNLTIVMYHYVRPIKESKFPGIKGLELEGFKRQLDYLSENFSIVSTEEVVNATKYATPLPKDACWLTFDDGYKSIITNVLPIIKKYNIPIIIFLCPDLFNKDGYLNQDDLNKLQKSGLVDFGIHGYKHTYYGNHSIKKFKNDFEKSIKWFNDKLNINFPKYFSFPYGSYNNEIIEYLYKHEMITHIFISKFKTLSLKKNNSSLIPRVSIWNLDNIKTFEQKINGQWDILSYLIKTNEK